MDQFHRKVEAALKKTLQQACNDMAMAVKAIAPVRTGKYRKSVNWRVSRSGLIGWVYASRKGKGVKRGSRSDTHNAEDLEYFDKMNAARVKKGKKARKRPIKGYIGHLLEYGTKRAKAKPHWTPVREYMILKFGPLLEMAIRSVNMYRTKVDPVRTKVGNFGSNTWDIGTKPVSNTGNMFRTKGNVYIP